MGINYMYAQLLQEETNLSVDTQIRAIGSVEPEIYMKMLRNLSEKRKAKFPAMTHGYYGKNCLSQLCFLKTFSIGSKPSRMSITAAKREEKEKKERENKI